MWLMTNSASSNEVDHLRLILDSDLGLSISASPTALLVIVLAGLAVISLRLIFQSRGSWASFEIDEAEFGLGDQKIKLRPNDVDRQIAYKIWVELSTRKIGLKIDPDNDVVSEIYDSWYNFFAITRELIKDVPVSKFQRRDTEHIVRLSIEVLNQGIRPHLTRWQARFRRWYEAQLDKSDNLELHPQDIQQSFPNFEELKADMLKVNERLMRYRQQMHKLVTGTRNDER